MTEVQLRQKLVDIAKSYYGCKESDGSHRKIIDLYNSYSPLPVGYKVSYSDPWCATYVSAMAIQAGVAGILPPECSCPRQITLFQKLGRWVENDGYVPKPGDVIYYDWDDSGSGDNTDCPSHVGLVTDCDGKTITVIEGNKSNAVGYRGIAVNGRYIRGFGIPDFASLADSDPAHSGTETSPEAFRYHTLGDVSSPLYRESLEKLIRKGYLLGRGGSGEGLVIDLAEDSVRMLVMLDRAGCFGV